MYCRNNHIWFYISKTEKN